MITKFNNFQKINEDNSSKYIDIKKQYNSLGEYVEYLYDNINEEQRENFSIILGEYLKIPKHKYNINTFKEGDIVLIEYWYNDILLPVEIIEKKGRKYRISFNIEDNILKGAPEEIIKKEQIVDHYRKTNSNSKEINLNTKFRISVAVNLLNPYDQMVLVDKLSEFKIDEKIEFKEDNSSKIRILGKTGYNSFLKILTALNFPNIDIDRDNCPNEFFLMYITEAVNKERLLRILKRFRSMNIVSDIVEESQENIKLYYGISTYDKLSMEYGILLNNTKVIIGRYKLNKRGFDELKTSSSKILNNIKEQISDLDRNTLIKLMSIKKDISEFSPGYFNKKSNPYIDNNILHQGYQGTGVWEKGTITSESLKEIEETFKKWVRSKKWFKDIQYGLSADKFWIKIKIRLK